MAKLTTTYNELKELGACQDGLDKLLEWCKKHPDNNGGYGQVRLTPADILESNGRVHLIWAIDHVRAWGKAYASWLDTLPIGADRGVEAWAKVVSAPKPLAKDLKGGDRVRVGGAELVVHSIFTSHISFAHGGGFEHLYHDTLDAIGFTLIEPKREPRRLKAEQILVPENVGTKWRKGGAVAEVQRHQIDCSSVGFWRMDEGRWCNAFDNVIIGEWEEVLE